MANRVKQFRFYGEEKEESTRKNFPAGSTIEDWVKGTIFSDSVPITQLGIQTLPGTKIYINNSENPIIVGITGIYELSLRQTEISTLRFDRDSLELIGQNGSAYLIVDILYKEDE